MRRVLLLLGAVPGLLVAGCGAEGTGGDGSARGTSLTIDVRTGPDASPRRTTLTCDPPGGDHPRPQEACEVLAGVDPSVWEPVPKGAMCTSILGGPQTATVRGTLDGAPIDARFDREGGCEIGRWDALGTTVLDVPLQ